MKPNILLFHAHDLGRHLGCYGVSTVHSPNIDRLASEGVVFSNSFCVAPQCSPSRAAMFTGRYPHNNGVMGLSHGLFGWDLHDTEYHLASRLRDGGYHTVSVGVMHETQKAAEQWGYEERVDLREDAAGARPVCDATVTLLERFAVDETSRRSGVAPADRKPLFLSVGCYEPHRVPGSGERGYMGFIGDYMQADSTNGVHVPPWLADDEGTRSELAELQGAIRYMDYHFGRVLEAVERYGLRENTLVIFTTDHGIAMPRAKCTCYDPGLEIALVLRLPSRSGWSGGRRVEALTPNIDLLPSLCELAGTAVDPAVDPAVQGRSWVPLLDADSSQDSACTAHRAFYPELTYHDYYDPIRAVRTEQYKLIAFFTSAPSYMPPNQSWVPRSSPRVPVEPARAYHPEFELYDLYNDPWEQDNVFDEARYADVRRRLLSDLAHHLHATDDPILRGAVTPPIQKRVLAHLEDPGKATQCRSSSRG